MMELIDLDFGSEQLQADPWPHYRKWLDQGGVHWSPKNKSYFLMSYDAVRQGMKEELFTVEYPFRATRHLFGPSIVDLDGPEHSRLKTIIGQPFRGEKVRAYETELMEPVVEALIDEMLAKEEVDFVADFARLVPMRIVLPILKLSAEQDREYYNMLRPIIDYLDSPKSSLELAFQASERLVERIGHAHAAISGGGCPFSSEKGTLNDDESVRHTLLLLAAGTETTVASIGNVMYSLLMHPDMMERARSDISIVPAIVRESLRWQPPLHTTLRFAKKELEIDGVAIPAGAPVQLCLGSASRDPRFYSEPDSWNPFREEKALITFGAGSHSCLGTNLALKELEVVFRCLLQRAEVTPVESTLPAIRGRAFHGLPQLRLKIRAYS